MNGHCLFPTVPSQVILWVLALSLSLSPSLSLILPGCVSSLSLSLSLLCTLSLSPYDLFLSSLLSLRSSLMPFAGPDYIRPQGIIHVVVGTGGAPLCSQWQEPLPLWSAYRGESISLVVSLMACYLPVFGLSLARDIFVLDSGLPLCSRSLLP